MSAAATSGRPRCVATLNMFGLLFGKPCDSRNTSPFCSASEGFDFDSAVCRNNGIGSCAHHIYVPESALPAESPIFTEVPPINPFDPSCQIPVDHGDAREAGPSARRPLPRGTFARVCIEVEDEAVAHAKVRADHDEDLSALALARDVIIADALRLIAPGTFFADLSPDQQRELYDAFMAAYFTARRKIARRNA